MSCWTNITGVVEVSFTKLLDSDELDPEFEKTIERLEGTLKGLPLMWSEWELGYHLLVEESSIFIIFRNNLRDFWEKYNDKKEVWETDYVKIKEWVKELIIRVNNLFTYKEFDKKLDSIYSQVDKNKKLILLCESENYNESKYNKEKGKLIKKIIIKEYKGELPIYWEINSLLLQWINSWKWKIKINLIDEKLEIIENIKKKDR